MSVTLSRNPALRFYREVCRAVGPLVDQFDLYEITSKHRMRRTVAERFLKNKDLGNPDAVDILILKGQQELQEYVERFKTRNHLINEWVYDEDDKERTLPDGRPFSPFLKAFLESNYNAPKVA